jgi:hypothetical protein
MFLPLLLDLILMFDDDWFSVLIHDLNISFEFGKSFSLEFSLMHKRFSIVTTKICIFLSNFSGLILVLL